MEGTGGKRRLIAVGRIFAPMREGGADVEIAREEEPTAQRNAGVPGATPSAGSRATFFHLACA